jgi:predicted transcriptional regulator
MGILGNNIKKIIQEFRNKSEYYSNNLSKEIKESFEDLKSEYDENSNVVPEFLAFVNELKPKLDSQDAIKLEAFTSRFSKVNRNARNGVEAMRELSRNQRKLSAETLRLYEEFEH